MATIIDERPLRTPREAQLKFVNGLQTESSRPFLFSIFHFHLSFVIEENQHFSSIKMANGKW